MSDDALLEEINRLKSENNRLKSNQYEMDDKLRNNIMDVRSNDKRYIDDRDRIISIFSADTDAIKRRIEMEYRKKSNLETLCYVIIIIIITICIALAIWYMTEIVPMTDLSGYWYSHNGHRVHMTHNRVRDTLTVNSIPYLVNGNEIVDNIGRIVGAIYPQSLYINGISYKR